MGRKHFQMREGVHCRSALAEATCPFYLIQTPARVPMDSDSEPNQSTAPSCAH